MAAIREARAVWEGDLLNGNGSVEAVSSRKFTGLPVSWTSRTEAPEGRTSPEELLAAAHATCFSMALSADLARAGTPARRLEVTARVTFDRVDGKWTVVASALDVRGDVPEANGPSFQAAADGAKDNCQISRALKGNVQLSVTATLAA